MSSFKIGLLGESGRASQEHLEHMFSTRSSAVHEDTPSQRCSVGTPTGPEDLECNRRCENTHSGDFGLGRLLVVPQQVWLH